MASSTEANLSATVIPSDDLAVAPHDVLVGREVAQRHGAARVQPPRRDAHHGTKSQAITVGETGRRVDDDHRRVDLAGEPASNIEIRSHDRFGVTGAEARDV